MDTVYAIYFDRQMYKNHYRKCVYLKQGSAKQVITCESKSLATYMYNEQKKSTEKSWYDLSKEDQQEWVNKAKSRFEIKEFIERR
jgi:TfoX/Sxy family transcriptional regulator of competence genes